MRHRLLALAPTVALLLAAPAAAADESRTLTAPVGSTKGSILLPYVEQENFLALQQESRR